MPVAYPPRRRYTLGLPNRAPLPLGERTLIMGILNVTPDSFAESEPLVVADEPSGVAVARALKRALLLAAEGADIIDVGGESTRPGSESVSTDEELARVVPVVRALSGRLRIPISIDTTKAPVARAALEAGAVIVNDVSGLAGDDEMAGVAARGGAALVLMHTRGRPRTMYAQAEYGDVAGDVARELAETVARATASGVPRDRVVVDPGIGFAKLAPHSYGVLARLAELQASLDLPVLVGPSRKSFLTSAIGERPAFERDWGTAAAVTAAVLGGAHIVRVHAVGTMTQVARVADAIRSAATLSGGASAQAEQV
jgi:dihydropteroate synthase